MSQTPPAVEIALLACDVFQEEIAALTHDHAPFAAVEYLEMGLHDQPSILRSEVQAAVNRLEHNPGVKYIVLAYGLCGHGLVGVRAGRCPLILPRAHDCISILLGSRDRHTALLQKNPGTYFYSPGWVRGKRVPGPDRAAHVRELYASKYPDDEEMIDDLVEADGDAFRHHSCAAYVDITQNQEAENYCQACAQHMGWDYKRLEGDPSLLHNLLSGDWSTEHFLTVPPGQAIALSDESELVCARA